MKTADKLNADEYILAYILSDIPLFNFGEYAKLWGFEIKSKQLFTEQYPYTPRKMRTITKKQAEKLAQTARQKSTYLRNRTTKGFERVYENILICEKYKIDKYKPFFREHYEHLDLTIQEEK